MIMEAPETVFKYIDTQLNVYKSADIKKCNWAQQSLEIDLFTCGRDYENDDSSDCQLSYKMNDSSSQVQLAKEIELNVNASIEDANSLRPSPNEDDLL